MNLYSQQVDKIVEILSSAPELAEIKKVYEGDFDVIPLYPAITVQLVNRTKQVRGIGGLTDTICTFNIWIYVNKPSYQSALEELEKLVDKIEKVLVKDRGLGGVVHSLQLSGEAEFGVTDRGGVLLQTALLQVQTRRLGVG